VLKRFGGHAMAAGCTIDEADFDTFDGALQLVAREALDAATLDRVVRSDGSLAIEYFSVDAVRAMDAQVWGQAFEAPLFCDEVEVTSQRLVGEKHLKLTVRCAGVIARRSGSAAASRWRNGCASPTASTSTNTTAANACKWSWKPRSSEGCKPVRGVTAPYNRGFATAPMNADLHCHSVVSDGTLEPEALAARARANGVELWALTDHDELGGQQRARAAALKLGLPYLTGTEISVTFANVTVHIVGLGFDADDAALKAGLAATRGGRRERAMEMAEASPRSASPTPSTARCSTSATPS
jgi:hypothetical protein